MIDFIKKIVVKNRRRIIIIISVLVVLLTFYRVAYIILDKKGPNSTHKGFWRFYYNLFYVLTSCRGKVMGFENEYIRFRYIKFPDINLYIYKPDEYTSTYITVNELIKIGVFRKEYVSDRIKERIENGIFHSSWENHNKAVDKKNLSKIEKGIIDYETLYYFVDPDFRDYEVKWYNKRDGTKFVVLSAIDPGAICIKKVYSILNDGSVLEIWFEQMSRGGYNLNNYNIIEGLLKDIWENKIRLSLPPIRYFLYPSQIIEDKHLECSFNMIFNTLEIKEKYRFNRQI